jgi:hypothetical protein
LNVAFEIPFAASEAIHYRLRRVSESEQHHDNDDLAFIR